jgi:serine/threonine protein kinase
MSSTVDTPDAVERMAPRHSLSDRYELLGRLGQGGMAEVWLARAVGLDDFEKIVVLKRILPHRKDNPRFVGMLRDEARVCVHLHHPNIVHTYDIGLIEDEYFVTMEYLHGEDVRSIVARAKETRESVPLELALQIAVGCAAGLHHAHEQSDYSGQPLHIVHRDVSPANIIVTRHSGVKLIDFGIAKATSGKEVTAVGMVKGKAAYMSPEQCRGEPLDRRSDVFSLGIVLYELLTSQRLFARDNQMATLYASLNEEPTPISSLRGDCPPELERIVNRALAKTRENRYQSAFELQEELEMATRDCRLHALPGALGRYLEHLFGPKPMPWATRAATEVSDASTPFDALVTAQRRRLDTPPVEQTSDEPQGGRTEPEAPITTMRTEPSVVARPTPAPTAVTAPLAHVVPRSETGPQRRVGVFVGIAGTLALAAFFVLRSWSALEDAAPSVTMVDAPRSAAGLDPTLHEPARVAVTPDIDRSPGELGPPATVLEDDEPDVPPEPTDTGILDERVDAEPRPTTRRTPKPANRSPDTGREIEARALLSQGQAALIRNDSENALALAKRALRLHATPDVYALLGAAACRLGRSAEAKIAHRHLRGSRRSDLARVCEKHGTLL